MPVPRWAQRALNALGIDPAVAFVLAGNVWIGLFSLVQVGLIANRLTEAEQGVNFTYLAFFQLILLFDLGFGLVIQQLVSHQRAFLHETPAGVLAGPEPSHTRLAALLQLTVRWYRTIFLVATALMLPAGWAFFHGVRDLGGVDWQVAWVLTAALSAGCVVATGFAKFLSGCGDVLAVARVTTLQAMAASLGYCAVLGLGGKLFAFPASQVAGLAVVAVWLLRIRRPLLADLWRSPGDRLTWYRDVRPFQSRIALSLISVQAFQLVVPVTAKCFGPDAAGQLGMSLSVMAALQMMGAAWLETRVPVFGSLIAKKDWPELDRVYRHVLWKSTTFLGALLVILMVANIGFSRWQHPEVQKIMSRFLPPVPSALVVLVTLLTHIFYARAAYLRAHCKEPYLTVTVLQAAALLTTMAVAGAFGTMTAMLGGCLFWVIIIGQGLGWWIFRTKRHEWHGPNRLTV